MKYLEKNMKTTVEVVGSGSSTLQHGSDPAHFKKDMLSFLPIACEQSSQLEDKGVHIFALPVLLKRNSRYRLHRNTNSYLSCLSVVGRGAWCKLLNRNKIMILKKICLRFPCGILEI